MKAIKIHSYLLGLIYSFEVFVSRTSIFISILGYVLLGNHVTAERIFAITAVYNCMRPVITIMFSISIASIAEVNISIMRLQKIMSYEDRDPFLIEQNPKNLSLKEEEVKLLDKTVFKNGKLHLFAINFKFNSSILVSSFHYFNLQKFYSNSQT